MEYSNNNYPAYTFSLNRLSAINKMALFRVLLSTDNYNEFLRLCNDFYDSARDNKSGHCWIQIISSELPFSCLGIGKDLDQMTHFNDSYIDLVDKLRAKPYFIRQKWI